MKITSRSLVVLLALFTTVPLASAARWGVLERYGSAADRPAAWDIDCVEQAPLPADGNPVERRVTYVFGAEGARVPWWLEQYPLFVPTRLTVAKTRDGLLAAVDAQWTNDGQKLAAFIRNPSGLSAVHASLLSLLVALGEVSFEGRHVPPDAANRVSAFADLQSCLVSIRTESNEKDKHPAHVTTGFRLESEKTPECSLLWRSLFSDAQVSMSVTDLTGVPIASVRRRLWFWGSPGAPEICLMTDLYGNEEKFGRDLDPSTRAAICIRREGLASALPEQVAHVLQLVCMPVPALPAQGEAEEWREDLRPWAWGVDWKEGGSSVSGTVSDTREPSGGRISQWRRRTFTFSYNEERGVFPQSAGRDISVLPSEITCKRDEKLRLLEIRTRVLVRNKGDGVSKTDQLLHFRRTIGVLAAMGVLDRLYDPPPTLIAHPRAAGVVSSDLRNCKFFFEIESEGGENQWQLPEILGGASAQTALRCRWERDYSSGGPFTQGFRGGWADAGSMDPAWSRMMLWRGGDFPRMGFLWELFPFLPAVEVRIPKSATTAGALAAEHDADFYVAFRRVRPDPSYLVRLIDEQDRPRTVPTVRPVPTPPIAPALDAKLSGQERAAVLDNLRYISSAKAQWAMKHNAGADETPTWEQIAPSLQFPKETMIKPQGGDYVIGPVGDAPRYE